MSLNTWGGAMFDALASWLPPPFDVLAEVGLTDLVRDADTRTSWFRKVVRHADYLLVSAPAKVRNFEVVSTPEVSDHRALVVELWSAPLISSRCVSQTRYW